MTDDQHQKLRHLILSLAVEVQALKLAQARDSAEINRKLELIMEALGTGVRPVEIPEDIAYLFKSR